MENPIISLIKTHFYCTKCHDEFLANDEDAELYDEGFCEPVCDECANPELANEIEDSENEFSFFDQDLGF